MTQTIISALAIFLVVILVLVALLLVLRAKLMPQGNVTITVNNDKKLSVPTGNSLISTLAEQHIYLPSACGGKGSCGQCRCRVLSGGGSILPTEVGFFSRKEIQQGWRLGCQTKVKEDMSIAVPDSILSIKEYECTVISNRNVASFIKEFKVQLPPGEHMNFVPGSYAQIKIPAFNIKYSDFDRDLIGADYVGAWEKNKMFDLRCVNTEPTVRAYSMANYPDEGDVFMLTVRIATPPFKPDRSGFMPVNPGIASSYIFSLRPGDKVIMSGPYGDFHVRGTEDNTWTDDPTGNEMIWVGGGAGMAPLRAQIMHLTRTLKCSHRPMHYFYGARALNEVFYLNDFHQLEKDFPNFHFHLALDRPDPAADKAGVAYTPGFVHNVMYDTYLVNHPAPEDIEYYMCGPGPMSKAVTNMLDNLGVPRESIMFDDFGG
ncbi:MAG: NADH:ubiquinone reductase (Na(+)-transporting) subunit F [Bacteroidales bacterium]|nr:NADH:ubiquinone reductase (Na(+)-transporting) subunit F [Bacteroidales bacterium]MCR5192474.1 NADH:ubiquinone reductase (Na(+)-transporting) subunit F [Bacteroidales bacterium]